ncbi:MAG: HAMP domain-containing histidine kinase [Ruminococcaceae bacterium]|nr:HAMP domain-containing histidine kinase [Oscillospiraceae bacterium]
MKLIKNKRPVSIFEHYFIILTCLVLFCLLISSLSLMLFVATTWSDDLQKKLTDGCTFLVNEIRANDEKNLFATGDLNKLMANLQHTSNADFLLCDENGKIVMCTDVQNETGETISQVVCEKHQNTLFSKATLLATDLQPLGFLQKGPIDIDATQDYILIGFSADSKDGAKFYLFAVQLLSVGYQPYITQYLKMTVGASCVAVIMAFFCSLAVTYRIVRPLRKMAEATKHYAAGDFSYRIRNVAHYEEFNELSAAFNLMAKNLEENEKSSKNFVANVSHELKTPMTTIGGFIDGILDGTIPPEETEHYLNIVSEVVKHLSGLVVSMLNMSKIEAGKVELEFSEFSLDQLLIQVFIGFEKNITDKNIDIIGIEKLDSVRIRADEALIRQVVYNLIDNAVKFTRNNGSIKIDLSAEKHDVKLTIANTGSTIPKDELNSIFDRFYKVDKSRGLDASSFGIGLHIVRSIVEMHSGTIHAVSKEEHTKFVVHLPLFNNV